jgi:AcrR family transcriptional regulator
MSRPKMDGPARRGRPQNPETRSAILKAASELLAERGLTAVTVEAISAKSGVSRPTIYRYWPNGHAVAMAAFLESAAGRQAEPRRARSAMVELRSHLRNLSDLFASRTGRSVSAMIAASQGETELAKAFRNHFFRQSREEGRLILQRLVEQGQVRRSLDVETALDLLYGPVYLRLLMAHAPLDAAFTDRLVDHVLAGLRP